MEMIKQQQCKYPLEIRCHEEATFKTNSFRQLKADQYVVKLSPTFLQPIRVIIVFFKIYKKMDFSGNLQTLYTCKHIIHGKTDLQRENTVSCAN